VPHREPPLTEKSSASAIVQRLGELERDYDALSKDYDALQATHHAMGESVGELRGKLAVIEAQIINLTTLVSTRFDGIDVGVERASGIKTAITFASVVIVPILVALLGGYFLLRAGLPSPGGTP
jgi:hypothetical protein